MVTHRPRRANPVVVVCERTILAIAALGWYF
jgi:hypothetical protein